MQSNTKQHSLGANPYSFAEFVSKRDSLNWYTDDDFLQKALKHFSGDSFPTVHANTQAFSIPLSHRWEQLAIHNARPENHPALLHYNAFNQRIDRIVRPQEIFELEQGIFGDGLFSSKTQPWESFVKRMLTHQLGEAGIGCPLTCTHGLIAILEHFPNPDIPELAQVLAHTKEGIEGDFAIGAQFMSEIQGGSDLPANQLEAVPEGKYYRLYGNKFFCSVTHADYSVVTARVSGSDKISTFIVPSWLPGNKEKELRNDYEINRLKWKMGTCELPTAEINYQGALAYPIGAEGRGIAIAVGIVLTLSRLEIGIACAGFMLRASREADLYADFRTVFGKKVNQYPLAASKLNALRLQAQRATAAAFTIYDLFLTLDKPLNPGLPNDENIERRKQLFDLRILVLLQKICATDDAAEGLRQAISVFAGHGVMEDFSSLPRILRDIVVNEQWEGPRNLLLTQIYRDISRVRDWYSPEDLVNNLLMVAEPKTVNALATKLAALLDQPVLGEVNAESLLAAEQWDAFCRELFAAYQAAALAKIA